MNVRGAAPTYCSDLVGGSRRGPRAGRRHIRVFQELGRSRRLFLDKRPEGATGSSTPGPTLPHSCGVGSESRVPGRYRHTKDNEVRRKGRREVGASRSTCEAGEPGPRGPCCPENGEGRGRRVVGLLGGNMPSASELDFVSTRCEQIAELAKRSPQNRQWCWRRDANCHIVIR